MSTNPPSQEPSVLDYVKSIFKDWHAFSSFMKSFRDSRQREEFARVAEETHAVAIQPQFIAAVELQEEKAPSRTPFPWRSLLALAVALFAQTALDSSHTAAPLGVAFYFAAFGLLVWALYRGEWILAPHAPHAAGTDPLTYRRLPLIVSLALALWAFAIFEGNLFTIANVTVWYFAVMFFLWAFWLKDKNRRSIFGGVLAFFKRDAWTITISRWSLVLLAAFALVFFFRFYRTLDVPPEPFSDHAEKIFDVYDISQGQAHIFFTRNTGREAFQMYWTLLIAQIFDTGLSYLSLKLGTAILGFLTLPYMYLLGKEVGGPRVGFFALLLAGIGYWPNVISRVGLRFPLYPLFVAPTLLYLIRGLRTRNRNDFLLSGLFLGLGLHGYSPFRIMPFVVVAAFVLYWLHSQSNGARRESPHWLIMLALTSLFLFLPLLRYWVDEPQMFGFRAFTRLSGLENPITQPVWKIFLSNLWNALRMFNYDDGEIWVHSVTHRPALDVVSAALFLFGVFLLLASYLRNRHWLDLFLPVSIPLLLMPSILSLAFPGENPALNRAGGAMVPAFVVAAVTLDGLMTGFGSGKMRKFIAWSLAGILLYLSAAQNFDLVFRQYYQSFRQSSLNTSEMGEVVREFGQTYGTTDTAFVVPFPYWVDTRLPAVWAGIPNRDMAKWRDELPGTVELAGPKLFIVKANLEDPTGNDQQTLDVLSSLYPYGQLRLYDSDVPGHDFWIFLVPR